MNLESLEGNLRPNRSAAPQGLISREAWLKQVSKERLIDILEAMTRYSNAGKAVPPAWITELRGLIGND